LNTEQGTRNLSAKAANIRLILLDVDGVLTDGAVVIYGDGSESKRFHIRDGIALVWAQRAGITVGLLSARHSPTTAQRAAQLGITLVHQGVSSKIETYDQIVGDMVLNDKEVAYMGDDIVDLAVLRRAGLSAAPANAVTEVQSRVDFVSTRDGGDGAVRELVELILRAQDQWDSLVAAYEAEDRL
jgi:3-deoxy-D-manno-octulosonate 8-phosphate phosphatase (KDO 8-P phosphatase)